MKKPDPVRDILDFGRHLSAAGEEPDKIARMTEARDDLNAALAIAQRLLDAWSAEQSALRGEPRKFSVPEVSFPLRKSNLFFSGGSSLPSGGDRTKLSSYLNKKKKPSVRNACLAAIYFLGPMGPATIEMELKTLGYKFGKGPVGNQIRSALWHARRRRYLAEMNGQQEFSSPAWRRMFESHELAPLGLEIPSQ